MSVKTARLHSARTKGGIVEVPTGIDMNNGQGVSYYLQKVDSLTGNRLFYMPAEWARMTDAEKARASKFDSPEIRTEHVDAANDLVAQVARADAGTLAAVKRLLGIGDRPADPVEHEPKKAGSKP
jgi:hypothetical protein